MSRRSGGSKLGAIAGIVIVAGFFLPWVRACGHELTGYDIATNSIGTVEDSEFYWLVLAGGALCLLFFAIIRTGSVQTRIAAAVLRLVAGLVGFLPLLNIWYNVQQKNGLMEVLYGGWIVLGGYVGIALSFFADLFGLSGQTREESND